MCEHEQRKRNISSSIGKSETLTEAVSAEPGVHDTRWKSSFSRRSRSDHRRKTARSLRDAAGFSSAIHTR